LRIAFNSWPLASRFRHQGIYVYALSLALEFKRLTAEDPGLEFCLFESQDNSNDASSIERGNRFQLFRTRLLAWDRLWRLGGVNLAAGRAHADLIFCPTANILPFGAIPVVCTVHDLTPIKMPSHSRKVTLWQRSMLWSSAKFSRAIITDSECSKRDLLEIYGLPESKVSVVYLGYDKSIFNETVPFASEQQSLLKRLGIAKPYVLHHGTIQPRKNLRRLIAAYRLLISQNKNLDVDLVLAGNPGWEYKEILAAASGIQSEGRVVFPGALSGPDLANLIKGAELVVIPSLYEGFCLPMVESMACGTPTIAARASCLPEVSGDVLRYFDPLSIEDMAGCMQQALEDNGLRRELVQRGTERAAYFDWNRCARETLNVLKSHGHNGQN
jgi:glycosyltransferase involved in cell wall biosynthesis